MERKRATHQTQVGNRVQKVFAEGSFICHSIEVRLSSVTRTEDPFLLYSNTYRGIKYYRIFEYAY